MAAIITFLLYFLTSLSFSIAVPIVLTALCVAVTILFFGWNSVLPKILPKSWLEKINLETKLDKNYEEKINNKDEKKESPEEENKNKYENKLD